MGQVRIAVGIMFLVFLSCASCAVGGGGEDQISAVAAPAFSPAAGTYTAGQTVTITTATPGASVRYTTDGTTPSSTAGTFYSGPVTVAATTTLKAVAYRSGWETSAVTAGAFSIEPPVAEPAFDPAPGLSLAPRKVTITTATPGASIRYTTDGSDPSAAVGTEYTGPVTVAGTTTLKAVAYRSGWTDSPVARGEYGRVGLDIGNHTVAVKSDGTVWSWGYNYDGQLGDGTTTWRMAPAQVPGLAGFVAASVARSHTIALKGDGTVWSWGDNYSGTLGDGTTTDRPTPGQVPGLADVVSISAGSYHVIAAKKDGTVWTWGRNFYGQLGDGTTTDRPAPGRAAGITDAVAVAAGHSHNLILRNDGTVWAFGSNSYGQTGGVAAPPGRVPGITGAVAVAAGDQFSLVLCGDGTVWAFGENTQGQLGDGTVVVSRPTPVSVIGMGPAAAVEAGVFRSLAVLADGTLRGWGANNMGALGDGTTTNVAVPTPVPVVGLPGFIGIVGGGFSSFGVKGDGTFWAWGDNAMGQLGDGTRENRPVPGPITF